MWHEYVFVSDSVPTYIQFRKMIGIHGAKISDSLGYFTNDFIFDDFQSFYFHFQYVFPLVKPSLFSSDSWVNFTLTMA